MISKPDPKDLRSGIWGVALLAAAGVTALTLVADGYGLPRIWALVILVVVAATAERQGVWVSERIEMSVSFLPIVFAAVAFGPLAAFAVGGLSNATDLRQPALKWLVYTPVRALSGVIAALAAASVIGGPPSFGGDFLASLAASAAWIGADAAFNAATFAVRNGDVRSLLGEIGPFLFLAVPLYVPLVALFVYGYNAYSIWVVIAFFIPALALQRLVHLYQEQRDSTRDLASANERLRSANLSFATALVATLDARDQYTAGHSAAVAIYARDIAQRMGLSDEHCRLAHLSGLVHDIGKIGLPAGLLEKPGALTLDERRQMEQHSAIGEQILRNVDDYGEIADIVRHHHERFDGLGYPDKLAGEQIPLLARIIGVADAYNAMTSDRPYRDALPSRVARLRLAQAVDTQFDTSVVAAFEAILASADEPYRMGASSIFQLEGWRSVEELEDTPALGTALVSPG